MRVLKQIPFITIGVSLLIVQLSCSNPPEKKVDNSTLQEKAKVSINSWVRKHPEEYKGHVGHVSTVIRIALMGRSQSPDVWTIQQILGEDRTRARIEQF